MKKILFYLLLSMPIIACAQIKDTVGMNIPMNDGHLIYEGVVDLPTKKQNDLYKNAKQWFVDHFTSSKDVIQSEDKEAGRIVGKGFTIITYKQLLTLELKCKMTVQIDCRDGKYRYKIYDILLSNPGYAKEFEAVGFFNNLTGQAPGNSYSKGQSKKIADAITISMNNTIASINTAMAKKTDDF